MRLYGIDAPEMPGACRPGRVCTPGDPYAARDYLASLTAGRSVTCKQVDTDVYDRAIVRCAADGADLSCAMVAAGQAVERYGHLRCGTTKGAAQVMESPRERPSKGRNAPPSAPEKRYYAPVEINTPIKIDWLWIALPVWLVIINIASWVAMATDKRRALEQVDRRVQRIPESTLLLMAAAGGSPATYAAQQKLRHKTRKQPFGAQLLIIIGLQLGVIVGLLLWPLLPV